MTAIGHEVTTHMSVAAAVQKGNADVGMGVYSSAKALDLDFVDVAFEEYDFVTYQSFLETPYIQAFLAALKSDTFLRRLVKWAAIVMSRLERL